MKVNINLNVPEVRTEFGLSCEGYDVEVGYYNQRGEFQETIKPVIREAFAVKLALDITTPREIRSKLKEFLDFDDSTPTRELLRQACLNPAVCKDKNLIDQVKQLQKRDVAVTVAAASWPGYCDNQVSMRLKER